MSERRIIISGIILGMLAGLIYLGLAKGLPTLFETPLRAENALAKPSKPERAQDIENATLALDLASAGKYADAIAAIRRPALDGYRSAQSAVGTLYYRGMGVPQDFKEAVRWWRLAADQGDPPAQFGLARALSAGLGTEKDIATSNRLMELSAKAGFAPAMYELGASLYYGNGGEPARSVGWHWLERAASRGDVSAQGIIARNPLHLRPTIPLDPKSPQDIARAQIAAALRDPNLTGNQYRMLMQILAQIDGQTSGGFSPSDGELSGPVYSDIVPRGVSSEMQTGSVAAPNVSRAVDLYESAFRRHLERFGSNSGTARGVTSGSPNAAGRSPGAINPYTGEFYPRAGEGYVSSRDGRYFAPAGPNAVVDTRTGQVVTVGP